MAKRTLTQKEIENERIKNLLSDYQNGVSNINIDSIDFDKVRSFFQLVKKEIIEASALDAVGKLYYKISLLQATPGRILSIAKKNKILFKSVNDRYESYRIHYWLKIDKNILSEADEKHLNDTDTVADEMIKSVERIFNYHFGLVDSFAGSSYQPSVPGYSPSIFDESGKKYSSLVTQLLEIITRGEQTLAPIMPLFLILAKEKELDAKIKKVEEIGKEQLWNIESNFFKKTADRHELKCIFFLTMAFILGVTTIAWGILSQVLFAKQDKICKEADVLFNFFPCWLLDIHVKDLLVGGVLVMGIVACLRAYFANAHSASISRHRFNSLQIYARGRDLIDPKDRDVFVQKATEAIFEQLPTGFTKYHKEDNKSSDTSAQPALIAASIAAAIRATRGDGS